MAEVIVSSLLEIVLDKLCSEGLKELVSWRGMDKQLKKLQSTLSTIQDVLDDAEARQVQENSLKGWLNKLKDAAYDAEDVLDKFPTKTERRKVRTKLSSFAFRHKLDRRIKKILKRLDEIAEERFKFHLQARVVVKEEIGVREETGSFVNESEVYGRQEDKEKVVEFLMNNSSGDDLGVMGIVGLGGLGKTTVARLAYNHEMVRGHFEKMIWFCVSGDSTTRNYRSIIQSVGKSVDNLQDMDSLERTLIEEIRGKRFLLVLDDVWDVNHINWNRLRSLLRYGATKGNKIIVTSRHERVASIMGTVLPYLLTGLSEADCWRLFEERAFGLGGANKTPNLVAIGREIVNKCGGVPLAAMALGSLMRFKKRESEWLTVKDSELWELPKNEILPALMLSYNNLPPRLKQCFAYCSIFPKDYQIEKEELVQLWIAEGFIRSSDEDTNLGDMGFQYVDELLSRSLLQDADVKFVKMHDIVHDLARSVAGDEYCIVDARTGRGVFQNLRYSSFLFSNDISAILKPLNLAKKLRTFYLFSTSKDKVEELVHVIFSKLKLLRTLHLGNCPIKVVSDSVSNLEHLRYLYLTYAHIETLPSCIGLLQNLQTLILKYCSSLITLPDSVCDLHNLLTLDLGFCSSLVSLPSSIGSLTSLRKLNLSRCQSLWALPESVSSLVNLQELGLRDCAMLGQLPENTRNMRSLVHLDIHGCGGLTCMPAGIGQLSHLRILPIYVLSRESCSGLGELGGLNLEGELEIKNLENARDAAAARSADLMEKRSLRSLELTWNLNDFVELSQECEDSALEMQEWGANFQEDVLDSLQPSTNLEMLSIKGYLGRKLPSWMLEPSLTQVVNLSLKFCFRCERLGPFGQLPNLKFLALSIFPVNCLGSEFFGGDGAFPLLKSLELRSMPALEEWSGATGGEIFPSLSKLCIVDCPKLEALPSTFPFVAELWMNADHGSLLSAFQDGAFSNLRYLHLINNFGGSGELPQMIKERMTSISSWTDESSTQINTIQLVSSGSSSQYSEAFSPAQLN